jgi:hypothetical protein
MSDPSPRFVAVLRAIAFAGTAASIPVVANCSRPAASGSTSGAGTSAPTTVCPPTSQSTGESCAGYAVGHECEWYGAIRCTCQNAANAPTPQWSCITRGAPGPLPPPDVA